MTEIFEEIFSKSELDLLKRKYKKLSMERDQLREENIQLKSCLSEVREILKGLGFDL